MHTLLIRPLTFMDTPRWRGDGGGGGSPGGGDAQRPLRILVHGLNYAPELTGIGKYTGEMCVWLAERGHEVRVVTAPPYYPEWEVARGYSALTWRREWLNGVRVIRCPLWVPRRRNGWRRVLHLASFAASAAPVMLAQLAWRPDVVIAIEPTLLCAASASVSASLSGAKGWLHVQDLETDAAFSLGMLPARLARPVYAVERALMRGFHRVSTISEKMRESVRRKGVTHARSPLFPNWVDCRRIHRVTGVSPLRSVFGIAESAFVALYSGNMGEKQGLEMVIEAAARFAGDPRVVFVMCGNGTARAHLQATAQGLQNIRWFDLQPLEQLNDLLNVANVHLLPQRADAADLVLPSKLTGMMASGIPVVATARPDTELGRVAAIGGIVTPPGDVTAFVHAIKTLIDDRDTRCALGVSGRAYAERHLGMDAVLSQFERDLRLCVEERAAGGRAGVSGTSHKR